MLRPGVYAQLTKHRPPQGPARQHPLHRQFNNSMRCPLDQLFEGDGFQPPGITGMSVVYFLRGFPACHPNLFGVNDHQVIPSVHVRGILRLMFPSQARRYFGRDAPQHFIFRIDEMPFALYIGRLSRICFHCFGLRPIEKAAPSYVLSPALSIVFALFCLLPNLGPTCYKNRLDYMPTDADSKPVSKRLACCSAEINLRIKDTILFSQSMAQGGAMCRERELLWGFLSPRCMG